MPPSLRAINQFWSVDLNIKNVSQGFMLCKKTSDFAP